MNLSKVVAFLGGRGIGVPLECAAAHALGVQLQVLKARGPGQFEVGFAAMVRGQADALFTLCRRLLGRPASEYGTYCLSG